MQNIKGLNSAVPVCNHVHGLDSWLVASAFYPRMLVFPTVPEKIDVFFPGIFFSLLGCLSIPRSFGETKPFFRELEAVLEKGRLVHFFPEGSVSPYNSELQDFKKGAFYLAAKAHVPILPMVITFRPPKGLHKLFRKKPVMLLTIGEPMPPCSTDEKEDERIRMDIARRNMSNMLRPK